MSSCEVVGGILFSGDEWGGIEERAIGAGSDLIDDGGFEIEHEGSGYKLAGGGLGKKGACRVIMGELLRIMIVAIGRDAMFEAEEFPGGIPDLNSALANVDGNDLSHEVKMNEKVFLSDWL